MGPAGLLWLCRRAWLKSSGWGMLPRVFAIDGAWIMSFKKSSGLEIVRKKVCRQMTAELPNDCRTSYRKAFSKLHGCWGWAPAGAGPPGPRCITLHEQGPVPLTASCRLLVARGCGAAHGVWVAGGFKHFTTSRGLGRAIKSPSLPGHEPTGALFSGFSSGQKIQKYKKYEAPPGRPSRR